MNRTDGRIPVAGPSITAREIAFVTDAVTNAWYSDANVYHERFERAFAEYVGVRHAVCLPSCTSALHLSLLAAGVGPGDEVIVPDITWIATSAPVSYVGAAPVFADIDSDTWCLDAAAFEAAISPRTKAVIPVDLYGNMPDMEAIRRIADRNGIVVIEDAAEAFGSVFRGRRAGSWGDSAAFSFHGSKTLTTGEGGMLVTDDEEMYRRALFLRDHGRAPGDTTFNNLEVAYKYKMSSMQAALGLAQLERAEELVAINRRLFAWYAEELADNHSIRLNHEGSDTFNTYWMVTVVVDPSLGLDKVALMAEMSSRGIETRPFFSPLSSLPAYAGSSSAAGARERNPVAYQVSPYGVNLPSAASLTRDQVHRVCRELKQILGCGAGGSGALAAA